jgi:hypothetical protein
VDLLDTALPLPSKAATVVKDNTLHLQALLRATASSKAVTVNIRVTLLSSKVDMELHPSSRVATLLSKAAMASSKAMEPLPHLLVTKRTFI